MKNVEFTKEELAEIQRRRRAAREKARRLADAITPEEDARIVAAAESDPDALPMTDEQLARMRPAHQVIPQVVAAQMRNRGGRPRSNAPKQLVTLRIKPDVLEAYRAMGKGWQTRMSEVLERGAKKMRGGSKAAEKRRAGE